MSLSGNLDDVTVADVLQFIHLGERSGTLTLTSRAGKAEIGFHRGRIVTAWSPRSRRLGQILIENGDIDQATLDKALALQKRERPAPPLGHIVIAMEKVSRDTVLRLIEQEIERTVYDLVSWTDGAFTFVLDEIKPVDELSISPGDIIPDVNINTQMVLLEATRLFDERNQQRSGAAPSSTLQPSFGARGSASTRTVERPRLQIVSSDLGLASEVDKALSTLGAFVVRVPLRDAGTALPGEGAPTVLVDVRADSGVTIDDMAALSRSRPRATLIALVDDEFAPQSIFEAGALTPVTSDLHAIVACFENLVRHRQNFTPERIVADRIRSGFAKLRRVFSEFRSGLISATVSLHLMNIVSESVERGILFLVRRDELSALGAFGFTTDGYPLAEQLRDVRLSLEEGGPFLEGLNDGRPRSLDFDASGLPDSFVDLIGRPKSGQYAIFPILGGQRVIATIYADNGPVGTAIDELDFLELATAQVGIAYENELLRRQFLNATGSDRRER